MVEVPLLVRPGIKERPRGWSSEAEEFKGSSGSAAVDIFVLHRKDNHEGCGDWKYIGAAIAAGLIAEVGQD